MAQGKSQEMTDGSPIILIVDNEDDIRLSLRVFFRTAGYSVLEANNGAKALELLRAAKIDVLLTDYLMSPVSGLDLLRSVKAEQPEVRVVLFTGYSSEDVVIEALRAGADEFFKKPFNYTSLRSAVENILQRRDALRRPERDVGFLVREEKEIVLDNEPKKIPGVVNQLLVNAGKFLNKARCRELSVALYEIILNAVEHGNLEISYQEKSSSLSSGEYERLIEARQAEPRLAARKVFIGYLLNDDGLHFTIRDEGEGFNWRE
ncbi:MAG: response regulator, partial [Deltaproteobacteria bacterium]|nr:response regulator [Deltaproteobacteria bacterium]